MKQHIEYTDEQVQQVIDNAGSPHCLVVLNERTGHMLAVLTSVTIGSHYYLELVHNGRSLFAHAPLSRGRQSCLKKALNAAGFDIPFVRSMGDCLAAAFGPNARTQEI